MNRRTIIRILVILITLAAVGFVFYWNRPSRVVNSALAKLARSDTQHFISAISVSNPTASLDLLGEQASIDLLVNGKFKRETDQRDSLDAVVQLTTKTETLTMLIEANARFVGDQAYLQITKAPSSLPVLAQLKNIWIELPRGVQQTQPALPDQSNAFTEINRGSSDEVDGATVKIYEATITSDAVIRMMDAIAQVLGTHLTEEQISSIQQGVANAETVPVRFAITPWFNEIRRISLDTTVPASNNEMNIEFKFLDRNQPVEITAPTDAMKLSDIAGASDTSE